MVNIFSIYVGIKSKYFLFWLRLIVDGIVGALLLSTSSDVGIVVLSSRKDIGSADGILIDIVWVARDRGSQIWPVIWLRKFVDLGGHSENIAWQIIKIVLHGKNILAQAGLSQIVFENLLLFLVIRATFGFRSVWWIIDWVAAVLVAIGRTNLLISLFFLLLWFELEHCLLMLELKLIVLLILTTKSHRDESVSEIALLLRKNKAALIICLFRRRLVHGLIFTANNLRSFHGFIWTTGISRWLSAYRTLLLLGTLLDLNFFIFNIVDSNLLQRLWEGLIFKIAFFATWAVLFYDFLGSESLSILFASLIWSLNHLRALFDVLLIEIVIDFADLEWVFILVLLYLVHVILWFISLNFDSSKIIIKTYCLWEFLSNTSGRFLSLEAITWKSTTDFVFRNSEILTKILPGTLRILLIVCIHTFILRSRFYLIFSRNFLIHL